MNLWIVELHRRVRLDSGPAVVGHKLQLAYENKNLKFGFTSSHVRMVLQDVWVDLEHCKFIILFSGIWTFNDLFGRKWKIEHASHYTDEWWGIKMLIFKKNCYQSQLVVH